MTFAVVIPLAVAGVINLVWMGLALGAVLRKCGASAGPAFVPVWRWVAAAQAARLSPTPVAIVRGLAFLGGCAAWTAAALEAGAVAVDVSVLRTVLVVGLAVYVLGSFIGWVLWIYGAGTIELRLQAPSWLTWIAALVPVVWASVIGWGPYSTAGRTSAAARAATPAEAPAPEDSLAPEHTRPLEPAPALSPEPAAPNPVTEETPVTHSPDLPHDPDQSQTPAEQSDAPAAAPWTAVIPVVPREDQASDAASPPSSPPAADSSPSVSPYAAPDSTPTPEPDWLVKARAEASSAAHPTAGSTTAPTTASAPEPTAASAAEPAAASAPETSSPYTENLPTMPMPVRNAVPAAPNVTPDRSDDGHGDDDHDDDHTIIATRHRVNARLVVNGRDNYDLVGTVITIGRRNATTDDVLGIDDPTRTVSKKHATLQLVDGVWHVTDLGSTNGTYLRNEAGRETEVAPGVLARIDGDLLLGDLEARIEITEDGQ